MPRCRDGCTDCMLDRVQLEIELFKRHIEVLRVVVLHQPIGIMKLAEKLDLPYHRIRYSLRVLEHMGYIRASPAGAVATPRAEELVRDLDTHIDAIVKELETLKAPDT